MPHAGAEFDKPAAAGVGFEGSLPAKEEPALAADDEGVKECVAPVELLPDEVAEARIAAPVGFARAVADAASAFFFRF